jgi:hypothetical protein
VKVIKYRIKDWTTGELEGPAYRFICRSRMRSLEMNIFAGANRYTPWPVKVEDYL